MEPNSPAALAGLKAYADYVIGADAVMNEVLALKIIGTTDLNLATC